ncbi:branched-chain amino acid ABC transporter permease [Plantibacter sp. PA-3-X8]|uniref:AzlC family ABC transporter permease n=1 Tax=Plantibacter sp. PA-3-X8 TaxID=2480625 RepID=UPI000F5D8252|nr:AzlC family ABC transporter permease [Plantibacter sp. PA-3-X8]AZH84964.1 branched-chain amino acid ABC transporter permease [Plantibacter sp. PA-3-X8]
MRSIWGHLGRPTTRAIALVCIADGLVGISYGAVAVHSGIQPWVVLALALLVLAGASEILFVGIVAAGGSPLTAALAGLLVNARHLPFGLAIHEVVGTGWRRVLGTHLLNDESVVFALDQDTLERKRAAFWACGLGILLCWPAGAALGAFAGTVIEDTDAIGLDVMFPAVLLALIFPALRERRTRRAALVGAVVAVAATPFLPAGIPVLLSLVGLLFGFGRKQPKPEVTA